MSDFLYSRAAFIPTPLGGFVHDACKVDWITDVNLSDEEFAAFFDNPLSLERLAIDLAYTEYLELPGGPTVLVTLFRSPSSPIIVMGAMIGGIPKFAIAPISVLRNFNANEVDFAMMDEDLYYDFKFALSAFSPVPVDGFRFDLCNVKWAADVNLSEEEFAAFLANPLDFEWLDTALQHTGCDLELSALPTILVTVFRSVYPIVVLGAMIDGIPKFALVPAPVVRDFHHDVVACDEN